VAKLLAAMTIVGPNTLGNTCFEMIRIDENPITLAACIYSSSLSDITCPRMRRAVPTHMVNPTAIKICQNPFPNANVIAKTNSKVGIAHSTLMSQVII